MVEDKDMNHEELVELTESLPDSPPWLQDLVELTDGLPPQLDIRTNLPDSLILKMSNDNESYAITLYNKPNGSIRIWFTPTGTFPPHKHNNQEWLILLSGIMKITYFMDNESYIISGKNLKHNWHQNLENLSLNKPYVVANNWCYHAPQVEHQAEFMEDSVYISIIVPAGI